MNQSNSDFSASFATLPKQTAAIVFNTRHQVIEANQLAKRWFGEGFSPHCALTDDWLRTRGIDLFDQQANSISITSLLNTQSFQHFIGLRTQKETVWLQWEVTEAAQPACSILLLTDVTELMNEVVTLRQQVKDASLFDVTTGLYNRHYIMERLIQLDHYAQRYHSVFSIALIDIDHFKRLNDTYGHNVGDTILAKLSNIMSKSHRDTDICGRFGGEEFLILMPETEENSAILSVNRLRQQVSELRWETIHHPVTISAGVLSWKDHRSIEQMLLSVDQRLRTAKKAGRNQVCGSLL